jgi:hypothetical protein
VTTTGSGVVVQTVPASLAEAMNSANISVSRTLTTNDLAPQTATASGVSPASVVVNQIQPASAASGGFLVSLNNLVLYDSGGGAVVELVG